MTSDTLSSKMQKMYNDTEYYEDTYMLDVKDVKEFIAAYAEDIEDEYIMEGEDNERVMKDRLIAKLIKRAGKELINSQQDKVEQTTSLSGATEDARGATPQAEVSGSADTKNQEVANE